MAAEQAQGILNQPGSFFGGANPMMQGAANQFGQLGGNAAQLANFGFGAGQAGVGRFLGGGLGQLGGITQQIAGPQIQGLLPQFALDQQQAAIAEQQAATGAGAFGGSRMEVGKQAALANQQRNQQGIMGQILGQAAGQGLGFLGQQQGQNLQLANLGFGAGGQGLTLGGQFAGQQFGAGNQLRSIGDQQRQEQIFRAQQALAMRQGATGPFGTSTTTEQPSNKFGNIIGGATAGFGMGGPLGGLIGGGAVASCG